jgi:hypothetical protein
MLESLLIAALPPNKDKAKFDNDHVYSMAPEAASKRALDLQIMGGDYSKGNQVRMDNEGYIKQLIQLASGGKQKVDAVRDKDKLQFFIIRGGAEGFLPKWASSLDASNVPDSGSTTSSKSAVTMRFDHNDLLAVFDADGKLVSSARLERPLYIKGMWSQKTADKVYNSWHNKEVFAYKNTSFEIPYVGIGVRDGHRGKGATVDMHKQEDTNGCIFIVDPNTPGTDDANIGKFEPYLIRDVMKRRGIDITKVKGSVSLGIIRTVTIK